MGTPWKRLLAPIGAPTGDGRRFAPGSISHRELPLALKFQRADEGGHDTAVTVGSIDAITITDTEVWGEGQWFDDIDATAMPRLAEDVAEAKTLFDKGVLGPSVDAGAADAVEVAAGTDQPLTDEQWEQIMMGAADAPEVELLFTRYEIAAATLVQIPAFAETKTAAAAAGPPDAEDDGECPPGHHLDDDGECVPDDAEEAPEAASAERVALVAALTADAPAVLDASLFADPQLTTVTPLTYDAETGRVYGHLATLDACHVAYTGMCVSPPDSATDYALFHRYPIDTTTGLLAVGRITTGHGRTGTGCQHTECAGLDDHACTRMSLTAAVAHHDGMRTLARVRVGVDDANSAIWFAGVAEPDLSADDVAVMARQLVSGDWREHAGGLELTEILALSVSQPGFPLPHTSAQDGRQVALVAAAPVRPGITRPAPDTELGQLRDQVAALGQRLDALTAADPEPDEATPEQAAHTGAMVALVPSTADAARLALDGGEPPEQLHLTIAYLGEADAIGAEQRTAIIDAVTAAAGGPVAGEAFAINMFNPADDAALVLGITGDEVADTHAALTDALTGVDPALTADQHAPWAAHVTLAYTNDLGAVESVVDRIGPVVFDRVRVAFAGEATDIPLRAPAETTAAALAAGINLARGALAQRTAGALLKEVTRHG